MLTGGELILVVDDDVRMLRMIKQILELEDFQVILARSGEAALQAFENASPDLILLDIMMPGMDGLTVCQRIREFSSVPIIMVTAKGGNEEVVEGLDTGADDYVTKPFSAGELAARVRAVLRRTGVPDKSAEPVFHLNDLRVDYTTRQVTLGRREIKLTAIEYKLLSYLTQNAGRIVTPDQLLINVWGESYLGSPHLIQVNIGRLRKKLGDSAKDSSYLITRPGIGYLIPRSGQQD